MPKKYSDGSASALAKSSKKSSPPPLSKNIHADAQNGEAIGAKDAAQSNLVKNDLLR